MQYCYLTQLNLSNLTNNPISGFLASAAKHLDTVDTMVKLGNILEPYLNQKLVQLDQSYLILANVQVRTLKQLT